MEKVLDMTFGGYYIYIIETQTEDRQMTDITFSPKELKTAVQALNRAISHETANFHKAAGFTDEALTRLAQTAAQAQVTTFQDLRDKFLEAIDG